MAERWQRKAARRAATTGGLSAGAAYAGAGLGGLAGAAGAAAYAASRSANASGKAFSGFSHGPPIIEIVVGVVMMVVGTITVAHSPENLLALAIGPTLALCGVGVLFDGMRRERRNFALERQAALVATDEAEILAGIEERRAAGEDPTAWLTELGLTDIRVRQFLLRKAAGRTDEELGRYLRRRG